MTKRYALASIGAGNMAEGIVAAVVAKGVHARDAIVVADPVAQRRALFAERFGVTTTQDNRRLVAESQRVLIAVKPQSFSEMAAQIAECVTAEHLLISIMAGKSTRAIAAEFAGVPVRIVRVMPNLPIFVGAGMAGICAGEHAKAEDVADVRAIFDAGGASVVVNDESLMDAVTAVSGSGPAYFYYFVEAMVEGGKACGLTEEEALMLARHTCLGAGRVMTETAELPAELRAKVTSKGGTTAAAIASMEQAGVKQAIMAAVRAAFERGRELGS